MKREPGTATPACLMSGVIAVAALGLVVVSILTVPVGAIFAPFAAGLFFLALFGVLGGLEERTVRQHNPDMNPRRWRDGS